MHGASARKTNRPRRSQTRLLLVLYAAGWTLAVLVATVTVLGLADYLIRYQDHGVRLMASLAVLVVAAWCCGTTGWRTSRGA